MITNLFIKLSIYKLIYQHIVYILLNSVYIYRNVLGWWGHIF